MFLKKCYGVGYTVTVLLSNSAADKGPASKLVLASVPEAEQLSSVGAGAGPHNMDYSPLRWP